MIYHLATFKWTRPSAPNGTFYYEAICGPLVLGIIESLKSNRLANEKEWKKGKAYPGTFEFISAVQITEQDAKDFKEEGML